MSEPTHQDTSDSEDVLRAPYVLSYPYRRSTGPFIGRWLGGLRARRILGVRLPSGTIAVPPVEADPATGAAPESWVELSDRGVLVGASWVESPRPNHPRSHPFAWALIQIDGADTPMIHVLDADGPNDLVTGMRVRAVWKEEREGHPSDLHGFAPDPEGDVGFAARPLEDPPESVTRFVAPSRLDYLHTAGETQTQFLRGIAERQILGSRCPKCEKVYVPMRSVCPTCGICTGSPTPVSDEGTVTTFCIVNIPFEGQLIPPPYACAHILLDGADLPMLHLIRGNDVQQVRMGLRVRAHWVPDEERGPTLESIPWFTPTDDPDAPYETYREHV